MNEFVFETVLTFSCPDCFHGKCRAMQSLPNSFKCNTCDGEVFFSTKTIKLLSKPSKITIVTDKKSIIDSTPTPS